MRLHELFEALIPSQYRNLVKGWDKQRYKDIFTNPQYTHDRNGYRVYIPIQTNQSAEQQKSTTQQQIEQELAKHGFEMVDYRKGIVRNVEKNQNIKIGKVLNKLNMQALLNAFNTDKSREGTKSEYMAVISRHPYDIAGMSTDRGWSSCMNLQSGSYNRYVPIDIREGSVIAYVTRIDDLDIKNPVGRVLLKPFVDVLGKPVIYFGIEDRVYGTNVPGFTDTVKAWVNQVNQSHELNQVAILRMNPNLYVDDPTMARQRVVTGKNITDQERETILKITQDPKELLNVENITDQMVMAMFIDKYRLYSAVDTLKKLVEQKKYKLSQNVVDRISTIAATKEFGFVIDLIDILDNFVPSADVLYRIFYDMEKGRYIRGHFNRFYEISKKNSNIKITKQLAELVVSKNPSILYEPYFQENPDAIDLNILKAAVHNEKFLIKALASGKSGIPEADQLYKEHWEELGIAALKGPGDERIVKTLVRQYRENNKPLTSEFVDAALANATEMQVDDVVEAVEALPEELQVRFTESQIVKILVKSRSMLLENVKLLNSMGYDLNFNIQQQVIKQSNKISLLIALRRNNLPINQQLADWALRYSDARAIKYISNPDRDQLKTAVMRSSEALKYFDEMDITVDPQLIDLSLELYPSSLQYIIKPTKQQIIKAVYKNKPQKADDPYAEINAYTAQTLFEALDAANLSAEDRNQVIALALHNSQHRLKYFINYDYYETDWLTPELQKRMVSSGDKKNAMSNLSQIIDVLKYQNDPIPMELISAAINYADEFDLAYVMSNLHNQIKQFSESDILMMAEKSTLSSLARSVNFLTEHNMLTDRIAEFMVKNHRNIVSNILESLMRNKSAPTVDWKIIRYGIVNGIEDGAAYDVLDLSLHLLFGHINNCWTRYKNDVTIQDVITIIEKSLENPGNAGEQLVDDLIVKFAKTLKYSPGRIDSLINRESLEQINKVYPKAMGIFDRYTDLYSDKA